MTVLGNAIKKGSEAVRDALSTSALTLGRLFYVSDTDDERMSYDNGDGTWTDMLLNAGYISGLSDAVEADIDGKIADFAATLGDAAFKDTGSGAGDVSAGNHNHTGTYAPLSHTHAAGDTTSGTFATARIPALNLKLAFATKTADYTLTTNNSGIAVDASGGNVDITLPAASANAGRVYMVCCLMTGGNTVRLVAAGGDTLGWAGGPTTKGLNDGDTIIVMGDGSATWVGAYIAGGW